MHGSTEDQRTGPALTSGEWFRIVRPLKEEGKEGGLRRIWKMKEGALDTRTYMWDRSRGTLRWRLSNEVEWHLRQDSWMENLIRATVFGRDTIEHLKEGLTRFQRRKYTIRQSSASSSSAGPKPKAWAVPTKSNQWHYSTTQSQHDRPWHADICLEQRDSKKTGRGCNGRRR